MEKAQKKSDIMDLEEFTSELEAYYCSSEIRISSPIEETIREGLVKSISECDYQAILQKAEQSPQLYYGIKHDRDIVHEKSVQVQNETISALLKYYSDKGSKKIAYARAQLKSRYSAQSINDQRRILRFFLKGAKIDREWAARILYDKWDSRLSKDIKESWERNPSFSVGMTVLHYLPKEYTFTQIDRFVTSGISKASICSYLGNMEGFPFEISIESLGIDFLYVCANLDRSVTDSESINDLVRTYILSEFRNIIEKGLPMRQGNSKAHLRDAIDYIPKIRAIIWALGKLKLTEPLLDLLRIKLMTQNLEELTDKTTFTHKIIDILDRRDNLSMSEITKFDKESYEPFGAIPF